MAISLWLKNDGIKKISHELAGEGIASFRFDKRIFKMEKLRIREQDLKFEDFSEDVKNITEHFKQGGNFSKIIIAGHSEGSLIGMLAAMESAPDAFVSLAGAGRPIDEIIVEQLFKQSATLSENAREAFEEIRTRGSILQITAHIWKVFSDLPCSHIWHRG
jgi:uncharacterized protein